MKRLMFKVTGAVVLASVAGCGTPTGPLTGADGKALTTVTGAPIEVVENPQPVVYEKVSSQATYAERKRVREINAKKSVQISRSDAELAISVKDEVAKAVIAEIRGILSAKKGKLADVVRFSNGRPQVTAEAIEKAIPAEKRGAGVSKSAITAIRALIEKQIYETLCKNVYPEWVKGRLAKVTPEVNDAVSKGKYAAAREAIWNASTMGIPEVDGPVREQALELMHKLVNPADWSGIEKKIDEVYQQAADAKDYDGGIANLKKLGNESLVREYSQLIDKKLAAVKEELKLLKIPEASLEPIFQKQSELIAAAANIIDVCDEMRNLSEATSKERQLQAKKDPALKAYYDKLEEFRKTLVTFSCTEENAEQIADGLDKELLALIDMLRSPAKFTTDEKGAQQVLFLGTRSLNLRIKGKVAARIKDLEDARDAVVRAAYLERLAAAKSDLEKQVRALVAEGKFEEARELIWNAAITGDAEWDAEMFTLGLSLLRNLVNPTDWTRIEKDIMDNFAAITATGDFKKLRDFLENYPLIRQHSAKLCEQLEKVRAEAEALGADPEAAAEAARVACGMVTEAEELVDHLDKVVAEAHDGVTGVDKSKLQKELEIYGVKLAAYHATPANVEKIVEHLRLALEKLIENPTNPETTRLILGTNAVNDRIRALVAKLLESIETTKTEWQEKEHARVITDLEKRVRKAVREQRFDDARNYIRDEKLIGRADLDLSLYELRVGLLDSCVNPAQLDFLLADIDAKVKALRDAGDYAGILKFIDEYPYVHDRYNKIEDALAAVKNAMLALEISAKESEFDEKTRFFNSIQEILEKRRETWQPERDLSGVEKALSEVAKALFEHLNKHPELIESERKSEYLHILADIAALDRTVTTWELNERLRAQLATYVAGAEQALAIQEYEKLLVRIDAEVSFDTQVSLAEEAISRQLGVTCDKASFKINALLGEYARVFRLLKKGIKANEAQATTLLLGAAYMDQPVVAKYALDLGADINGVSDRDPRGRTALALAIDRCHFGLVEQFVKAGASLKAVDKDGNAIVHYAAKSGNLSVLKAITAGAPVNVKNACGNTPLAIAVVRNQPSVVEFLVAVLEDEADRLAFVNSANNDGLTAFGLAAKFGSRDVLDALAAGGADFGTKDLILAEKADHVAIAQWLVTQGLDVNAEGVMAAACPATRTGRYLIAEGGVQAGHACAQCDEEIKAKELAEAAAALVKKDANVEGCKCKPQPVDVLLVPQCGADK